jgi:hypothetical protein
MDEHAGTLHGRDPIMFTRRQFMVATAGVVAGAAGLHGCTSEPSGGSYDDAARRTWAHDDPSVAKTGTDLQRELVRYATLAPSSHNTQCWRFALQDQRITILPDLARRCPAVDPDNHHLYVSLGAAAENLAQAALAHGLMATAAYEIERDALDIALAPARVILNRPCWIDRQRGTIREKSDEP